MELHDFDAKLDALHTMGRRLPVSLNYHDLSLNRSVEAWSSYRTFVLDSDCEFALAGISDEDGSLNLYASSPHFARVLADEVLEATADRMPPNLRGGGSTERLLDSHPSLGRSPPKHIKRFVPFRAAINRASIPPLPSNLRLRRATREDGAAVLAWTTAYNQELGESFPVLTADMLDSRRVMVLEDISTSEIHAGYIRTIINPDRYWLARFYVFPDFRGRRFGRILLDAAKLDAGTETELHLHVVETNHKAIDFYTRMEMERVETGFNARLT